MKEEQAEIENVQVQDFYVVGISVLTANVKGRAAVDIGELWGRFYDEGVMEKVEGRDTDDIYSVYTDYESDHLGEYRCLLGVRVSEIIDIPDGMMARRIEGGNYLKLTARGMMPGAVFKAWNVIWQHNEMLNRAYKADFEVYGDRATYGDEAEVDIYLSIK